MTDKSAFTDEEWHALTDAPLLVTAAVFFAGEHGPISMLKGGERLRAVDLATRRTRRRQRAHRPHRRRGQHEGSACGAEGAPWSDTPGRDRECLARSRAGGGRVEEAAGRRGRPGCGMVPLNRRRGGAVGQDGQPRRTGDDRQARRAVRRSSELSRPAPLRCDALVTAQLVAGHSCAATSMRTRVGFHSQRTGEPARGLIVRSSGPARACSRDDIRVR
jgi:hypothetical protein